MKVEFMSLDHPKLISLPTYFATKLDDIKTACVFIFLTLSYLNEGTNPVKKSVPSMYLLALDEILKPNLK